jgi:hypothetical protein
MAKATIFQKLARRGFGKPKTVQEIRRGRTTSGIYVLHFGDGWHYVGKSIAFANRLLDHSRRWKDIEAVSVKALHVDQQAAYEERLVETFESEGVKLRNKDLMSCYYGLGHLEGMFSEKEIDRWLGDHEYDLPPGKRDRNADQAKRTADRWASMETHRERELILEVSDWYINRIVPRWAATEQAFWSVTSYAEDIESPYGRSMAWRFNAQIVETAFLYRDFDNHDWVLGVYLATSAIDLYRQRDIVSWAKTDGYALTDRRMPKGGDDQIHLEIRKLGGFRRIMDDNILIEAARKYVLNQMTKGICRHNRSHCPQIVDHAAASRFAKKVKAPR